MLENLKNNQLTSLDNDVGFEIIDAENHSLVKMYNTEGSCDYDSLSEDNIELEPKTIDQLNHWISSIPATATAIAGNSSHLMTCNVEYSRLMQTKNGGGAIGAIPNSTTGKIDAQARFNEAKNLKSIVNINLIVNIASQILAQKHLADINEHLQKIEKKIDSIQEHLEKKRISNIQTLREQLYIIGKMLSSGDTVVQETLQTLAIRVQDVRKDAIHLKDDIDTAISEIKEFDPVSRFGSNDIRDELNNKINKIDRLQHEYFSGMQCILMANLILFIKHDGNNEFILANDLYIKELNDDGGFISKWENAKRTIKLHLSKMKPLFERTASTNANILQVTRKLARTDNQLNIYTTQLDHLNNKIHDSQSSKLILEVVDGKIQRGHYLNQNT